MRLINIDNGLMLQVRWSGLPEWDDTVELLQKIYEVVSDLMLKLHLRKYFPEDQVAKEYRNLHL